MYKYNPHSSNPIKALAARFKVSPKFGLLINLLATQKIPAKNKDYIEMKINL